MNRYCWSILLFAGLCFSQSAAKKSKSVPVSSEALPKVSCGSLQGVNIPSSQIGLPTTGATISSATLIAAADQISEGNRLVLAIPEYCKVNGYISPVDPTAPKINFQVNLPTRWNRKMAQMGGSGLNGTIPVSLTTGMQWGPESIPPNAPYALSRGFVVYGSDSGHQNAGRGGAQAGGGRPGSGAPGPDGPGAAGGGGRNAPGRGAGGAAPPAEDWITNNEALVNFAYAQVKKTHDVTLAVIKALYSQQPRHSYFFGSSQGGREAFMAAQRFPQDYDGIFCQVPVFPQLYWNNFEPLFRAQSQAGEGWVPPSKVPLIADEVRRQCDDLDGLKDGLVSNYLACDNKFDPAVSPNALAGLRCPEGKDAGDTCLSDAQIKAVNAIHGRTSFPFPLYKGWSSFPGWTTGGEGNGWKVFRQKPDATNTQDGWIKSLIAKDPNINLLEFKPEQYKARIQELSAMLDAIDTDLSAFNKRGGKLILKVNSTDYVANPRWSFEYFDKVTQKLGKAATDRFIRFYVGISITHGRNVGLNTLTKETVPTYFDSIAMLDDWVEKGTPPSDSVTLTDMDAKPPFTVHSTFPMCRYPTYPLYKGKGDPKDAASFSCSSK